MISWAEEHLCIAPLRFKNFQTKYIDSVIEIFENYFKPRSLDLFITKISNIIIDAMWDFDASYLIKAVAMRAIKFWNTWK